MSNPLPDLGTILSVWAHPDDESYCCAGLMADAVRRGNRVVCITATRGELGSSDELHWPPGPPLAEIRTRELDACLTTLGITEHHWLDYPDGGCADVDDAEAIARIRAIAEEVQPDTVLTFGPDGSTWHPDHIAVSRWATEAVAGTGAAVHWNATTPEWFAFMSQFISPADVMMDDREAPMFDASELSINVTLEGELLDLKYDAMLCQESQIAPLLAALGPDNYHRMLAAETFRPASAG
ncbi:MAG: mycothiol S-conjugate amidase [Pseudonocardiales bacterium]|nr:mycothiol S-conjugate amidase [Pseudonocardiales bacterium]